MMEKQGTAKRQLLKFIGTVTIPATTEPFVAAEKFVVADVPVKISWFNVNFRDWFFGKTEEPDAEARLCYAKLVKPSVDVPILAELRNKAESETTLAQIYSLMKKQASGEAGALLTNGFANVFYARDVRGVLRAVRARWDEHGWSVLAYSVASPAKWSGGTRVFSRSS